MRLQYVVVAGSRVAVSSRRFPSHISDWAGRFGSHCSGVLTCMWAENANCTQGSPSWTVFGVGFGDQHDWPQGFLQSPNVALATATT